MRYLCSVICALFLFGTPLESFSQGGFHFGVKGGPTLASQVWNFGDRRPQITYHGNLFVETRDLEDRGSLFAQAGIHNRGSSLTLTTFGVGGGGTLQSGYSFQNAAITVGAKKNVASNMRFQPYYMLGIRLDYNITENLEELIIRNCVNNPFLTSCPFPDPIFLNKLTYGIMIGGGLNLTESEFFNAALEFSFSPDLNFQIQRPSVMVGGVPMSELQVRNVSFEISLVLRFLREVIYEE